MTLLVTFLQDYTPPHCSRAGLYFQQRHIFRLDNKSASFFPLLLQKPVHCIHEEHILFLVKRELILHLQTQMSLAREKQSPASDITALKLSNDATPHGQDTICQEGMLCDTAATHKLYPSRRAISRHLPIQSYTNFIMETKYNRVQNHKQTNSQKTISLKTVNHQSENTTSCSEQQNLQGYRWKILLYTCSILMLSISSCWGSLSETDYSYNDLFFE